jgi:hypothetical protein
LIDSGDDKEVGNNSERLDDGGITWWDFVNGRNGNGWEDGASVLCVEERLESRQKILEVPIFLYSTVVVASRTKS